MIARFCVNSINACVRKVRKKQYMWCSTKHNSQYMETMTHGQPFHSFAFGKLCTTPIAVLYSKYKEIAWPLRFSFPTRNDFSSSYHRLICLKISVLKNVNLQKVTYVINNEHQLLNVLNFLMRQWTSTCCIRQMKYLVSSVIQCCTYKYWKINFIIVRWPNGIFGLNPQKFWGNHFIAFFDRYGGPD